MSLRRWAARRCVGPAATAAALCCAAGSWTVVGGTARPQKRPGTRVTYAVRGTADAGGSPAPVVLRTKQRRNPKDGAEMVWIPPGSFQMGDSDQSDNPPHRVTLSGYWMYRNDVTVQEYRSFCRATGRRMPPAPSFDPTWSQGDHPIVDVTWDDAAAYAKWAGCDLPTEAQWEKAARGTDGRKYPWGSDWDISKLWCSKSLYGDAGGTTAVGHYGVSPYGCSDMAGNVWDWCRDWYHKAFWSGRAGEQPDPVDLAPGQNRVVRGGSWKLYLPVNFRTSNRGSGNPANYNYDGGFRCALRAGSP
ncbi:MAG: SUMF1/EgtB/PvdO family nonheme iron enzyme [Armatimonadetes bacterium]|nr:SUMF1/EgtB/PvdO family nonheme iron enzyme [Armatimonadota bacterium]MDE2207258.1 SUMF1/EgtB/PvdO family nonheme iron enzyme [Armatimonadota bacterium]